MPDLSAKSLFQELELPTPWIPTQLEKELKPIGQWVLGTSNPDTNVYDIKAFVEKVIDPDGEDFLFVGHEGHGTQSYFLHYYLRLGSLRILLQAPYGGVYDDPEECQEQIAKYFDQIERLAAAQIAEPVVIVQSPVIGSRWGTIGEDNEIHWTSDDEALKTVADSYSSGPNSMISV
ncbi:hypothetical protein GC197_09045 [bacterium]|nr:hypothetical protein [bacterium]